MDVYIFDEIDYDNRGGRGRPFATLDEAMQEAQRRADEDAAAFRRNIAPLVWQGGSWAESDEDLVFGQWTAGAERQYEISLFRIGLAT